MAQNQLQDLNGLIAALGALTNSMAAQNNRPMEKIIIPIRKYRGNDQDPTEWLKDFNIATQANGITDARKVQLVRGYLEDAAALWYDKRGRNNATQLTAWSDNQDIQHSFSHQFATHFCTRERIDQWQDEIETL